MNFLFSVYNYYKIFASKNLNLLETVKFECENAKISCSDCKKRLAELINLEFKTIREKRNLISDEFAKEILHEGNKKARKIAQDNISELREILSLNFLPEI